MYYSYSYTNIGKRRLNNEDRLSINGHVLVEDERYIKELPEGVKSFVVLADGMGGTLDGEVAALMTVSYFNNEKIAFDEMSVNRALATINSQVVEYSSEKLAGVTAGSTVVGIFTLKNEVLVFNAGDSLMYSFENGSFTELSLAHNTETYDKKMRREGLNSHSAGLLEFIGNRRANRFFSYNIFKRRIKLGEVLFLSTDGVTDYYPNPEDLAKIFSEEKNIEVCAQTIIDHVLRSGAHDNFSFSIVVKTS